MPYYPFSSSTSTPQQRRPSDPTWSTRRPSGGVFSPSGCLRTPRSRKKTDPLKNPNTVTVTYGPGKTGPLKVLTPTNYKLALKKAATSTPMTPPTSSTNTPGRARAPISKRKTLLPPGLLSSPSPPTTLVSPPMQGTPRREPERRARDPARPTVQLLDVLNKCLSDDNDKDSNWTLTDALLNGRNDPRDRSRMWNTLSYSVCNVWPELRGWIMCYTPIVDDYYWFTSTNSTEDEHIYDPDLGARNSSLERVGFYMTPIVYNAACKVIQRIATTDPGLRFLESGEINPFFLIYACADCDVPLPSNFSRQLLWKHLDAILRAKCWRGLGSARAYMHQPSADADHVPPKIFRRGEQDPDGILEGLLRLSCNRWRNPDPDPASAPAPAAVDVPSRVHKLQITMEGHKWVAKTQLGTVWYRAGDLYDEDDIACFAVIDSLTRLLHYCMGGTLEISSANIRLLWGVGGGVPSGGCAAWSVVKAVCGAYKVHLRCKWSAPIPRAPDPWRKIEPTEINVPPRDREVVDSFVSEFMQRQLDGKVAHQRMVEHLLKSRSL